MDAARRLLQGEDFGVSYAQTLGCPAPSGSALRVAPRHRAGPRMAEGILAGLRSALVYVVGERLAGRGPVLMAAAIYALDPLLVVSAGLLYLERLLRFCWLRRFWRLGWRAVTLPLALLQQGCCWGHSPWCDPWGWSWWPS
jgi:hypothetical protein